MKSCKCYITHCVVSIEIAFDKSLFRIFHDQKSIVEICYSYLNELFNFILKVLKSIPNGLFQEDPELF